MSNNFKVPGPLLTSIFRGIVDLIPLEWRAKLGIKQTDQENPVETDPDELTGTLVESKVAQIRTDERKKTNIEIFGDTADTMVSEERLPTGQIATRTRSLLPEGTALEFNPGAVDADQKNLGIGWLDQTVIEAGLPGPTIFSTRVDRDGVIVSIGKTRKLISDIVQGETLVGSDWIKVSREGETDLVATEVVETRPIG